MELSKMRNRQKWAKVHALYSLAKNYLPITQEVLEYARVLQSSGIKIYDSLHLALAEVHCQDVLLTTDDAFLKAARRMKTATVVAEPVSWFMEVTHYDS